MKRRQYVHQHLNDSLNDFIISLADEQRFATEVTNVVPVTTVRDNRATGATRNRWYTVAHANSAMGVTTPSANFLYAVPLAISQTRVADQMAINVTTLGASSNARVGIYADDNCQPGALLIDGGEVSTASIGVKTYATAITLTPGLYWLSFVCSTTSPVVRGIAIADVIDVVGHEATLGVAAHAGYYAAFTYAALPASFPTIAGGIDTAFPAVFIRFAS